MRSQNLEEGEDPEKTCQRLAIKGVPQVSSFLRQVDATINTIKRLIHPFILDIWSSGAAPSQAKSQRPTMN